MGVNRLPGTAEYKRWYEKRYGREANATPKICPVCLESFKGRPNQLYCSRRCKDIVCRGRREKRIKNADSDGKVCIRTVYKRDGGICYLCGARCSFNDWKPGTVRAWSAGDTYPTIDHVIPISKGGKDTLENVRLACWKCNVSKGARCTTQN